MKVVWIEESVNERWEQQEDGSEQLRRETVYLPTYEYTVNGKTYRYASRQTVSGKRELGRQVVGYYDPTRPDRITENKPRKPVLGGMCFFMFAAFLLWFGIMSFAGMLSCVPMPGRNRRISAPKNLYAQRVLQQSRINPKF